MVYLQYSIELRAGKLQDFVSLLNTLTPVVFWQTRVEADRQLRHCRRPSQHRRRSLGTPERGGAPDRNGRFRNDEARVLLKLLRIKH